ncbi:YopX family protein [Clostridium sp.]|uniref:YopX family protein n=1 Tax=Clostridium sp. TaxID=1506 RepID=UPI001B705EAE|nr:YopX family protein [Clostridium sp.]MBP3917424.1 hypothetical protein [Clostridium sp.]
MREVILRAYDKDSKKMVQVVSYHMASYGCCEQDYITACDMNEDYTAEVVETQLCFNFSLNEYTGYVDSKGKKIFEGDIVKYRENTFAPEVVGKVVFANGCWFVDYNFPHCISQYLHTAHQSKYIPIEVIGNIYENIDLLEV